MDIKCPHCGTEYEIGQSECGMFATCQICGKDFVMGASKESQIQQDESADAICPYCKTVYEVGSDWRGKLVACEACGRNFTIGLELAHRIPFATDDSRRQKELVRQRKENESAKRFFSLQGRASRKEWWIVTTVSGLLLILIGILVVSAENMSIDSEDFEITVGCLALANLVVTTPVSVRRFHDMNLSGWFVIVLYLITIIPARCLGFANLWLGLQKGTRGDNAFGADPLL